jgi:hypothetical protein
VGALLRLRVPASAGYGRVTRVWRTRSPAPEHQPDAGSWRALLDRSLSPESGPVKPQQKPDPQPWTAEISRVRHSSAIVAAAIRRDGCGGLPQAETGTLDQTTGHPRGGDDAAPAVRTCWQNATTEQAARRNEWNSERMRSPSPARPARYCARNSATMRSPRDRALRPFAPRCRMRRPSPRSSSGSSASGVKSYTCSSYHHDRSLSDFAQIRAQAYRAIAKGSHDDR